MARNFVQAPDDDETEPAATGAARGDCAVVTATLPIEKHNKGMRSLGRIFLRKLARIIRERLTRYLKTSANSARTSEMSHSHQSTCNYAKFRKLMLKCDPLLS